MALRSLLARTTTATLSRARARAPSVPVCAAVPRMSPASSSRRYTSQGGYGVGTGIYNKEFHRHLTDQELRELRREATSDKIWSFVGPVAAVLGLGVYTTACLSAGYFVGLVSGYCSGFGHGVKALNTFETMISEALKKKMEEYESMDDDDIREALKKMEELEESTDDDIDEAMTTAGEVAESADDDIDEAMTTGEVAESTDDDVGLPNRSNQ